MSSSQAEPVATGSSTFSDKLRQLWPGFDVHSIAALMALAIVVGFSTGLAAVIFIKAIAGVSA